MCVTSREVQLSALNFKVDRVESQTNRDSWCEKKQSSSFEEIQEVRGSSFYSAIRRNSAWIIIIEYSSKQKTKSPAIGRANGSFFFSLLGKSKKIQLLSLWSLEI